VTVDCVKHIRIAEEQLRAKLTALQPVFGLSSKELEDPPPSPTPGPAFKSQDALGSFWTMLSLHAILLNYLLFWDEQNLAASFKLSFTAKNASHQETYMCLGYLETDQIRWFRSVRKPGTVPGAMRCRFWIRMACSGSRSNSDWPVTFPGEPR